MEAVSKDNDALRLISDKLNMTVLNRSMREICYSHPELEAYKDYSIMEYIQLYKTSRMFELGVISEYEYESLIELFATRKYLNSKLVSELINESASHNIYIPMEERYISKNKATLAKSITQIDELLRKYNLNSSQIDLKSLIDYTIQGEAHQTTPLPSRDELEAVTIRMRELTANQKNQS